MDRASKSDPFVVLYWKMDTDAGWREVGEGYSIAQAAPYGRNSWIDERAALRKLCTGLGCEAVGLVHHVGRCKEHPN